METFQKRQKALARKEKQQKKAARRIERKNEKASADSTLEGDNPPMAEPILKETQDEKQHSI